LKEGNARRKTEETGANSASSRSHAVLEIWVTKHEKNHYDVGYTTAKLTLVDLAVRIAHFPNLADCLPIQD